LITAKDRDIDDDREQIFVGDDRHRHHCRSETLKADHADWHDTGVLPVGPFHACSLNQNREERCDGHHAFTLGAAISALK